eukprot:14818330-Alexandrium_andersonii.AAC.1
MSASLVGSEMCIRDRCATRRGAPEGSAELHRAPKSSMDSIRRASGGPVSYTHLTLPTICSV